MITWLLGAAWGADRGAGAFGFDELVCVQQEGAPRGAVAIAASPLVWAHGQRRSVQAGRSPQPDPELLRWVEVDAPMVTDAPLGLRLTVAESPTGQGWVVVAEARAWQRLPVVAPNFTLVVDVSESMGTVATRRLPPLQDEASDGLFRPVTRMELSRTLLVDLLGSLPDESRVSIVAMDGFLARQILPPTSLFERSTVAAAIDALKVSMVAPTDKPTVAVLQSTSERTFGACHDNKVVLLTDDVGELIQKQAVEAVGDWARPSARRKGMRDVERWSADDVEVWSFSVGNYTEVDSRLALLEQAAGGAAWLINARSDGQEIWRHVVDPGGVVAGQVELRVDFPAGADWREVGANAPWSWGPASYTLHDVTSGQAWSRVYEVRVPEWATPDEVRFTEVDARGGAATGSLDSRLTPFAFAYPSARAHAVAAWWLERPDDPEVLAWRALLPERGRPTELRAWMSHAAAARRP